MKFVEFLEMLGRVAAYKFKETDMESISLGEKI